MADVRSSSLTHRYKDWSATATSEQIALVDAVYLECEEHYSQGGDTIVECYDPTAILAEFKSVAEAKAFCGLKVEQELNCRSGEDNDPQLRRMQEFDRW